MPEMEAGSQALNCLVRDPILYNLFYSAYSNEGMVNFETVEKMGIDLKRAASMEPGFLEKINLFYKKEKKFLMYPQRLISPPKPYDSDLKSLFTLTILKNINESAPVITKAILRYFFEKHTIETGTSEQDHDLVANHIMEYIRNQKFLKSFHRVELNGMKLRSNIFRLFETLGLFLIFDKKLNGDKQRQITSKISIELLEPFILLYLKDQYNIDAGISQKLDFQLNLQGFLTYLENNFFPTILDYKGAGIVPYFTISKALTNLRLYGHQLKGGYFYSFESGAGEDIGDPIITLKTKPRVLRINKMEVQKR